VRVESRGCGAQPNKAADEQPGASQQDHRERHLAGYQQAMPPVALAAGRRAAALFSQGVGQVGPSELEGRRETEQQAT
jgi:hypothetical protein